MLNFHPRIRILNELNFFNNNKNYRKGLEWYKKQFDFDNKNEKYYIIGDKTTAYSRESRRIKKCLPDVKIIWIVRNPINRTYSHYWHGLKWGDEISSFEYALLKEKQRIKNNKKIYPKYHYISVSIYYKEINKFFEVFRRDQFYFLTFEELINNPIIEIKKIFKFLNIKNPITPSTNLNKNTTTVPANKYINRILGYFSERCLKFGFKVFSDFILVLLNLNLKLIMKRKYPKMNIKTREILKKFFESHNLKLKKILGLNIEDWI